MMLIRSCERKANLKDLLNERVAEVDTSDPHDYNQRTMRVWHTAHMSRIPTFKLNFNN